MPQQPGNSAHMLLWVAMRMRAWEGAARWLISATLLAGAVCLLPSMAVPVSASSCAVGDSSSFASKIDFGTGLSPQAGAFADVDGDGKPDLVMVNHGSNTVSVLRNTSTSGSVSFATKVDFGTGSSPFAVAVTDVDGDGKPDLVVANASSNIISVLGNICLPPPSATVSINALPLMVGDTVVAAVSLGGTATTSDIVWKLNGSVVASQTGLTFTGTRHKGETLSIEVTPRDSNGIAGTLAIASTVIANTPPIVSLQMSTAAPETHDTLTVLPTGSDADADTVTFSYVWKRNTGVVNGQTTSAYAGTKLKGDVIRVEVTPNDGTVNGTMVTNSVTVVDARRRPWAWTASRLVLSTR
jgi:hypothetical protein